jgi:hypothetical protein
MEPDAATVTAVARLSVHVVVHEDAACSCKQPGVHLQVFEGPYSLLSCHERLMQPLPLCAMALLLLLMMMLLPLRLLLLLLLLLRSILPTASHAHCSRREG